MNGWICPKCGKVWGPFVMECGPCNQQPVTSTNGIPVSYGPPLSYDFEESVRQAFWHVQNHPPFTTVLEEEK